MIQTTAGGSTIGGGVTNTIQSSAASSTIGGGVVNTIQTNADYAVIGGGDGNRVSGHHGTVPGGEENEAGINGFAAGRRAKANHPGTFVWADSQNADFASTGANQFLIRASGGIGINKTNPSSDLDVQGTITAVAFSGSGAGLTGIVVTNLDLGSVSNVFWRLGGNAGTTAGTHFLGTTDNQPVELKVNNQRALRLEYPTVAGTVPNLIGGHVGNSVGAGTEGAVIAGGGAAAGFENTIGANGDFSAIGGGYNNGIGSGSEYSTIAGGYYNDIGTNASNSVIGGGYNNDIAAVNALATIAGGYQNMIGSNGVFSTIGGGHDNKIEADSDHTTVGGGQLNVVLRNSAAATISGGYQNEIGVDSDYAIVSGGSQNQIGANATYSVIGGGANNDIFGLTTYSVIAGGNNNSIGPSAIYNTISGGQQNQIGDQSEYATVAGGSYNFIDHSDYASIGGGYDNRAGSNAPAATISGGYQNLITNAGYGTIGGGHMNLLDGSTMAVIGGGDRNRIDPDSYAASIAGGMFNRIWTNASYSTIGGGNNNQVLSNATYAIIPGGQNNAATNYGFAAGRRAKALHMGAFVWADSQNADFASSGTNQFIVRASGGVGINKTNPATALDVNGTISAISFQFTGDGILNGGQLGIGSTNPLSQLHVSNDGVSPAASALENDEIIVGADDAVIGLYSTAAGTYGSALAFKEISGGGAIVDNWGFVRTTRPTGSDFLVTYGTSDNYSSNPAIMTLRTNGTVGIGTLGPEAPLHVAEGNAGAVTASGNSAAVFERNTDTYISILTPTNGESGVLFGSPTSSADGGVLYNGNSPRGLEFRTAGNNVKMVIESGGDVGIGTTNPTNKLHVIGGATFASGSAGGNQVVVWTPGSGSWSFTSDRNAKDRIAPVDTQTILEKIARLPINEWSYIGYEQRHIGPMAQDFHARFPLNENDKALNDADLHGVALAAIQGLNEKVEGRSQKTEDRIQKLEAENAELRKGLRELQQEFAVLTEKLGQAGE